MAVTETAARLPSRIAHLIYLCAFLPQPGDSVFSLIARNRGHEPLSPIELAITMSNDKRTCSIEQNSIIPLFYPDVPTPEAVRMQQRFGIQGSLPLAAAAHFDTSNVTGISRHYVCCTEDKVIPLHHQQRMLAAQESQCTEHRLITGHSPFLSCPAELANLLLSLG